MAHADGSGVRKLANVGSDFNGIGEVSLSPDGKEVRFSEGGILQEMNADGTGLHRLLPNWQVRGRQYAGRWTPDGAFYLFVTTEGVGSAGGGPAGQIWALDERHGLFRKPSPDPIPLTTGPTRWGMPLPGRDGHTIFSVGQTARGELSRWDKDTRQFQPFLGGISSDEVYFSRDGQSIAYVTYPDGVLWKANRDGSNPVELTQPPSRPMAVSWSPDGKQFAYYDRSDLRLYTVASDGGPPVLLMPGEKERAIDPVWSPDGKHVSFGAIAANGGSIHYEGRTLDLASGYVTSLPEAEGKRPEGWSPDGRYILAMKGVNGGASAGLLLLDLRTKQWKTLLLGEVNYPHFSHDGRFIYFLLTVADRDGENHMDVYRIPVTGGKAERVIDMKDFHTTGYWGFSLQLDPTDAPLVLRDISSDDIYALSLSAH